MQYGLELSNAGPSGDARTLADLAALAEAAGWDGVFLEDYIVHWLAPDVPTYDPWVALAAIAVATQRVRLGTTVTPLTRRRPWKVAREAVTLDHLSNGRFVLGVGLGDANEPGYRAVGEVTDNRTRAAMLDEALEIITGLWTGQPFSYQGQHYQVAEMICLPTPVQQPRIPIWVGGNWPHKGVMRRAARWDGFVGGKVHEPEDAWHLTVDEIRQLRADLAQYRTDDAPLEIALGGGDCGPDPELERARVLAAAAGGATWWMEFVPPGDPDTLRARIRQGPRRV
jgi:alkanesulfonate monooxygenase SsuD/methylene tetrahydromethanopterin reductase-like flavin-dependent oxidoreductase (luciferase family)